MDALKGTKYALKGFQKEVVGRLCKKLVSQLPLNLQGKSNEAQSLLPEFSAPNYVTQMTYLLTQTANRIQQKSKVAARLVMNKEMALTSLGVRYY